MTIAVGVPTIRSQLAQALGQNGRTYWQCLKSYLKGEVSRYEFDERIREIANTPDLLQLHNQFIISLLSNAALVDPPTPPPDAPKSHRKRGSASERTMRLKRWSVGMGKRERERIKSLEASVALAQARAQVDRRDKDEITLGRAVRLLKEGRDPPGTHLPQHLCFMTRTITQQNIAERIALIAAQNDLGPPGKAVSQLIHLALEAKLKHLVAHAISLSSTSHTVSSIQTSSLSHVSGISRTLSASSFDTLFTVAPAVMPYSSAAALRLNLPDNDRDWTEDSPEITRPDDARAQMIAALRAKNNHTKLSKGR